MVQTRKNVYNIKMTGSSDILAQYKNLEQTGNLDLLANLRTENRELERIITDAALLVSYTDIATMLEYLIAKLNDHFIPQFMAFLVHPPRGDALKQYCFRNLKESADHINPIYYDMLKERFKCNPMSASFADIADELGQDVFGVEFRHLNPEMVFPMFGIGGLYGIVILGSKLVGGAYTDLEQKYVDRMIRFLSVSMQNGLHYESSITDPKTGLYTHDYFVRRLDETIAYVRRRKDIQSGILMLDVDHFKRFNDTWGHVTGDAVLVSLSNVLKQNTRKEDCAARFGGEEFSVLVTDCSHDKLMLVAERIRKSIEEMNLMSGDDRLSVTVSIGARMLNGDSATSSLIFIGDADKALYRAKAGGRNQCVLYAHGLLERASWKNVT